MTCKASGCQRPAVEGVKTARLCPSPQQRGCRHLWKLPFPWDNKQSLPPGAHLTLHEEPGKRERSTWCWGSAKRPCMRGDMERLVWSSHPLGVGGHPGWAVDVCCFLAGRCPVKHFSFVFLSFVRHEHREGCAEVQLSGMSPSLVGTQPLTEQAMIYTPWWRGAAAWVPVAAQRYLGVVDTPIFSSATKSSPASQYLAGAVWALSTSRVTTQ